MNMQRFFMFTMTLCSTVCLFILPGYPQYSPNIFTEVSSESVNTFLPETQIISQQNGNFEMIREGNTVRFKPKILGLIDREPQSLSFQAIEPHVSDNKQEVDQEWYAQTFRDINIMSKVFDHVMKEAFADGYQQSGFFNKGCQGFWIPNQGVMFQLQVNFPLEQQLESQTVELQENQTDDLWSQMENQLTGKSPDIRTPVLDVTPSNHHAARTKELQDLIIETITKYGKKFDSFGDDESIMVMVHSPQYVSYFSPNLMGQPATNMKDTSLLPQDHTSKQEQLHSLMSEYETQLKKLQNKYESDKDIVSRWREGLARLSQQYKAGVVTEDMVSEKEIQIIEIERQLKDTEIDMEAVHKKISDLKEQTDDKIKDDIDIKSHYESLIQEKVANELKEMIGEGNFKIQVNAVFDWDHSSHNNHVHIDGERPVQANQKIHDENGQLQENTSSTGVVSNVQDEDIDKTNKTTIEEIINNVNHPWTETLTEVKDGTVNQINITVKLNDDHLANRTTAFLDENGTIKRQEESNRTTWSPESLSRIKNQLKHKLGIPNFPNGDFPPVEFVIVSESFRDETVPNVPILGGLFKQGNASVRYQPITSNKTMIIQVEFSDLNPEEDIFRDFNGISQSDYEDQVKDAFRITIY